MICGHAGEGRPITLKARRNEATMNQNVSPLRPSVIPPPAVDVPRAQVDAIHCLIDIIDTPYCGDDLADYHLRRNKCEAARVLRRTLASD